MEDIDPTAIRALAHPLRLDLLDLLAATGPATAAHCGRMLGASQASCSFHLRQLAKYGFVEDAGPGDDRRARIWRLAEGRATIRITADEHDAAAQAHLERVAVQRAAQAILDYTDRRESESPEWRRAAGFSTMTALLTPDEAADLQDQWLALLTPYLGRTSTDGDAADRRPVRCVLAATPQPTDPQPTNPGDDDARD